MVTAIGDYSGFVHKDLDKPVPDGNPKPPFLGNTKDVSGGEKNPNVIVRVGRARHAEKDKNLGYSTDGGKTWHEPAALPDDKASEGDIAVSTDGNDLGLDAARGGPLRHRRTRARPGRPARACPPGRAWWPIA